VQEPETVARLFKVFSVAARVRILQLLQGRALCVGALAHRLGMSSAAVSQHLRILRDAGLVTADKRANFVHYSLAAEKVAECRNVLDQFLIENLEGERDV